MAPDGDRSMQRDSKQSIKEGRAVKRAADRATREADRLAQQSDELRSEIGQASQDWQRKRADQDIPGATPPDREAGDDSSRNLGDASSDAGAASSAGEDASSAGEDASSAGGDAGGSSRNDEDAEEDPSDSG